MVVIKKNKFDFHKLLREKTLNGHYRSITGNKQIFMYETGFNKAGLFRESNYHPHNISIPFYQSAHTHTHSPFEALDHSRGGKAH